MFMTPAIAIFLIAVKASFGAVIGAVESKTPYRSRLTWAPILRGIALGIVGFLTGSFLAGWASAREAFYNGERVDTAPWGENLWLRNRIVEHELLLSFLLAMIAVMCDWMAFGNRRDTRSGNGANHE
jgi:hypothetical protein